MAVSLFTPEIRGALLERFAAGCSLPDAGHDVGVSEKTLKHWLTRGRKDGSGEYAEFAAAVDAARADVAARPAPMDEAELAHVVSAAARKGNTQAMKLRWEMLRSVVQEDVAEADPLAALDELASRRAVRA